MKNPRLEVICVGTELLSGKTNTHTADLAPRLATIGLSIAREHTVGDDASIMEEAFREVYRRSDVVICAGGLGPTFDDITRDVWSRVLKRRLRFEPFLLKDIQQKFKSRGIRMPPMNRRQALVLDGAEVIPNRLGTAPGQFFSAKRKTVVLLPGPGRELFPMMEELVLPRLQATFTGQPLSQKTFLVCGVPESHVDSLVRPWVAKHARLNDCDIVHGILASRSIISVKFTVKGRDPYQIRQATERLTHDLRRILKGIVFGEDGDTLEGVVGRLLRLRDATVASAESCTGGLVSKILTDEPGSSDFFVEGVTTYHNRSKMRRLGVREQTLKKFGAVSAQTAREMAAGMRRSAGTDYAVSITGIAGPAGGTAEKPVGLVYIGCATPRHVRVKKFLFNGERGWIRHRAALVAIDFLRKELLANR